MGTIREIAHEQCTGCGACYNKCPHDAITMEYDLICPLSSRQVKYQKQSACKRSHKTNSVAVFLCAPIFFIFLNSFISRNRIFLW